MSACLCDLLSMGQSASHTPPSEKSHQRPCENVFVVAFMAAQITTETTDSHVKKVRQNRLFKVTSADDRR